MEVMCIYENADRYTAENKEREDCHHGDKQNVHHVHGGAGWLARLCAWFNDGGRGLDQLNGRSGLNRQSLVGLRNWVLEIHASGALKASKFNVHHEGFYGEKD